MNIVESKRACGVCTACCTVMGVVELEKDQYTDCVHANNKGCRIYEIRPESCRAFNCGWLLGMGKDEDRPDKIGIVIDWADTKGTVQMRAVLAREVFPGAFEEHREFIDSLAADGVLVFLERSGAERQIVATPEKAAELQRHLAAGLVFFGPGTSNQSKRSLPVINR